MYIKDYLYVEFIFMNFLEIYGIGYLFVFYLRNYKEVN